MKKKREKGINFTPLILKNLSHSHKPQKLIWNRDNNSNEKLHLILTKLKLYLILTLPSKFEWKTNCFLHNKY